MTELAVDEETLWYQVTGSGRPLVFVHGGWSTSRSWKAQVDRFAGDYQVVTLDVRGHGQTGATDRSQYSIDLFVDDLERLLEHLGIDRPLLCGISLGGMIVQSYLDRYPARAAGAILAGPARSMPPVELPVGVKPFVSPRPALAASAAVAGPTATFESLLGTVRATTGGPWLANDPAVREQARDAVGDMAPAEFRKVFGALYEFDPPELSHVETPALVLYGNNETALVKRQGEELAAAVDGDLVTVSDAGHLVNEDNPEAFNAAVDGFLAELPG